jgi:hypothetical protein
MIVFQKEADAQEFVEEQLRPFCHSLVRQPIVRHGLRPDIRVFLQCLPEIPIYIEIKTCNHGSTGGKASAFCSGVAQASSYADVLRQPVFVAPLDGATMRDLDWQAHQLGSALLLGGHFNVGGIYMGTDRWNGASVVGFLLGGSQIAFLSRNRYGQCTARLHSNAAHLLKYKERFGSFAIRKVSGEAAE